MKNIGLLIVLSLLFAPGCKQKVNNPLLGTPDSTIASVDLRVRGVNNFHAPEMSILIRPLSNSGAPMADLSAGNFAILHDNIPAVVTHYGPSDSEPFAVMLVMDRSGSMTGDFGGITRRQASNDAATIFLTNLPSSAQAGLVEFDSGVKVTVPMTSDKNFVISAVNSSSFGGGGTALYDAIIEGGLELAKASGLRILIILTDGADSGSRNSAYQAASTLLLVPTVADCVVIGGDVDDTTTLSNIILPTHGALTTSLSSGSLVTFLSNTLESEEFDNIYALTFRRQSTEPNLKVFVNYGSHTDSADLIALR